MIDLNNLPIQNKVSYKYINPDDNLSNNGLYSFKVNKMTIIRVLRRCKSDGIVDLVINNESINVDEIPLLLLVMGEV